MGDITSLRFPIPSPETSAKRKLEIGFCIMQSTEFSIHILTGSSSLIRIRAGMKREHIKRSEDFK